MFSHNTGADDVANGSQQIHFWFDSAVAFIKKVSYD